MRDRPERLQARLAQYRLHPASHAAQAVKQLRDASASVRARLHTGRKLRSHADVNEHTQGGALKFTVQRRAASKPMLVDFRSQPEAAAPFARSRSGAPPPPLPYIAQILGASPSNPHNTSRHATRTALSTFIAGSTCGASTRSTTMRSLGLVTPAVAFT